MEKLYDFKYQSPQNEIENKSIAQIYDMLEKQDSNTLSLMHSRDKISQSNTHAVFDMVARKLEQKSPNDFGKKLDQHQQSMLAMNYFKLFSKVKQNPKKAQDDHRMEKMSVKQK